MSEHHRTWSFRGENHVVAELEHLFGFDLVMSRRYDDEWVPVATITRDLPLSVVGQRTARLWVMAYDDENYAAMASLAQRLHMKVVTPY